MKLDIVSSKRFFRVAKATYEPGVDPKLECCPFCGSDDLELCETAAYWIQCQDCGVDGPCQSIAGERFRTEAEAIAAHEIAFEAAVGFWNTRFAISGEISATDTDRRRA